jgi:hypothetical protein
MKPLYLLWALVLSVYSFLTRSIKAPLYFFFPLLLIGTYTVRAEGTLQVMPTGTVNGTGLIVNTSSGFPLGNVGSYLGAPSDLQLKFRIKNYLTETLYYGFHWEQLTPNINDTAHLNDVYMIIYDPLGNPVGSPIKLASITTQGPGFIQTYNNAKQGPKMIPTSPIGYNAATFTPSMNGDYHVSFYRSKNGGVSEIAGGSSMLSKWFDLTIVQNIAGAFTPFTGRIHCNEWAFSVFNPNSGDIQDPLISSNATFYTYTADSVVVKVYLPAKGYQPLSFIIAFNSFGVINGGNWLQDRKSIVLQQLVAPYLSGGYDVFLNQPDPSLYVPCTIPRAPSLVSPTISGCPPGPFNVRFRAPQAGDYYILFDLNGQTGYQANSADRFIELINQSPGIITYVWDGKDGQGNPVPANTTFPISFSFRKGRVNIPFYDVELNVNGFFADGIAPISAPMTTLYWDDSQLVNEGTDCSNGTNGYVAGDNNYTGTGYNNSIVGQKSPGHAWNGDGNSGFVIPAPYVVYGTTHNDQDNVQCNDFGNARLINTWTWGIDSTITQTLTLTCISISGTVWDDADGSAAGTFNNIRTNSEPGTNAGNQLYANLIDPATGTVLFSVAVNANGTYTFNNCPANATGMQVVLSATAGAAGSAVSAILPAGWINTSPLATSPFNTVTSNITGIDFGIEQIPNAAAQSYIIAVPVQNSLYTLNGASTLASPGPLKGSDPEDGVMGSGKSFVITQLPANEQLWYNGSQVTPNTTIPNYNPALLQVKFTTVNVPSTVFQYAFVDAAGMQGTPATYMIQISTVLATTIGSFTGRNAAAGNILNWIGYNETNGAYYDIERSSDGISFTSIGRIDGAGNGATGNHEFTDPHPVSGVTNYYRLVLTDLSGAATYSNVIPIASAGGSDILEVAPNPFRDALNIRLTLTQAEKIVVRLLDSKGMLLRQSAYGGVKGSNALQLGGLGSLPISVYFIQIISPDQVFVRKVFNR